MDQDSPEQPLEPPMQDAKGRFVKGNKFGKGRVKGVPNKFGPSFREKLLAGFAASGTKKAKKSGTNQKIDGITAYAEHIADTNSSAAAGIISKMIPPEPEPSPGGDFVHTINIVSVPPGHQQCPDGDFRPEREATPLWEAHKAKLKEQDNGSHDVVDFPTPRARPLKPDDEPERKTVEIEEEARLIAELEALPVAELARRAKDVVEKLQVMGQLPPGVLNRLHDLLAEAELQTDEEPPGAA